ncbi:dethiobiotin synthase [Streptomyces aidingensis]|uniref:ATP-dependent dethiobiotin synthetase BioD n=1 Tax=Streptomyces aidingensis TaxID=910347 RepID=A0A1I1PI43_9ACTN|nr:dethiobiotin synthase [Streptomyces aidingensis]SFD09366.1 dethiobiotin synthetase [Streptomyces aidingensis]
MTRTAGIAVVTGTGTGVGKTVATAALAAAARAAGLAVAVVKPAQTGVAPDEPGDVHEVRRLAGGEVTGVEVARYPEPLAPSAAARRAGLPAVRPRAVVAAVQDLADRSDLVLVEGAGGLLVPFDAEGSTLADLALLMRSPVVVVTSAELGTLNHTALTTQALRVRGLRCPGLVIGSWPAEPGAAEECNREDLPVVAEVPVLGVIPERAAGLPPEVFRASAPEWVGAALHAVLDTFPESAGGGRDEGR